MQAVPELLRSRAEDYEYPETVVDLLSKMRSVPSHGAEIVYHQEGVRFNTASHTNCGFSEIMFSKMEIIMVSLRGLSLPS